MSQDVSCGVLCIHNYCSTYVCVYLLSSWIDKIPQNVWIKRWVPLGGGYFTISLSSLHLYGSAVQQYTVYSSLYHLQLSKLGNLKNTEIIFLFYVLLKKITLPIWIKLVNFGKNQVLKLALPVITRVVGKCRTSTHEIVRIRT